MSRSREEVAAELVWRYVEYIREETGAGRAAAFSRDELDQLVRSLETASRVPDALDTEPCAATAAGVRKHLYAALAGASAAKSPTATRAPAAPLTLRLPRWALPASAAVVLVLAAALAAVPLWHRPRPVVRRVYVPYNLPDVQPLSEGKSREMIPLLVTNDLGTEDERNLMWHMLVCRRCFDKYVDERKGHTVHADADDAAFDVVMR